MRTGIFGGSFNPIHSGHISLARQLKVLHHLDEVWLMVSPQNPLKTASELLPDAARLDMARAALRGEKGIIVSDYEMHLPRPSYTWNTLQALRQDYPDRQFVLMIGGDNWASFDRWYRADDIRQHFEIVVYPRRGSLSSSSSSQPSSSSEPSQPSSSSSLKLLDVSSTEIRERIRAGRSIHRLVPASVERIILERGYYKS